MVGLAGLERHGLLRLGRKAAWLGALSYPLYICHEPLMLLYQQEFAGAKFGRLGLYLFFLGGAAAIFAISAAVTFLFDRPIQRLLRVRRQPVPIRMPAANTSAPPSAT